MDLEGIVLSEISQMRKTNACFHSYVEPKYKANKYNETGIDSQIQGMD